MNNQFWYWFSMVLIVAAALGLGLLAGYIVGLKHGVAMILEDIDDDILDEEGIS